MLLQTLQNLGLNAKEAKLYLAAVELGSSPISHIASKAKLNRITAYDVIEKLIKKGLINSVIKNKTKYFSATDPEQVINEFQKKAIELKNALPELKKLHGETSHPKVRYYEGLDGIKKIYADTLESKTEILNYCHSEGIRNIWPEYDQEYVKERIKRNIRLKGIAPNDDQGRKIQNNDRESLREIRLIPKTVFNFKNEISVYDNKVSIISFGKDETIGMIIESAEIANMQRDIFHIVWQFAEELDKKVIAKARGTLRENDGSENVMKVNKVREPLMKKADTQGQLFEEE